MSSFTFSSIEAATAQMRKDMRARELRLRACAGKAAARARAFVASETIPVAFGELRQSLHVHVVDAGHAQVIADAPHAAAVENGSRPHWVPLDALVAWVKLRGMQGLQSPTRLAKSAGSSTQASASAVAAALRGKEERVGHRARGVMPIDAAVQVAKAIQFAIAKHGTKPHHYMLMAVDPTVEHLDRLVVAALADA